MNQELTASQSGAAPSLLPTAAPLRVLLIEDRPGDARLIELMLADAGAARFHLRKVSRLSAGLDCLRQEPIDVVLLDLSLPDSQGFETFKRVQRVAPGVPIIVLSGLDDEGMAVHAVHEGAEDYLVKGHVDSHLLARSLRYSLERRRFRTELEQVAQELREKNGLLEADLTMAREIQQVLLPQQYPTFPPTASPKESALRFHHLYRPTAAVGGDFFSLFAISDMVAGAFISDVTGHGMRAALVTALLRGLMEELKSAAAEPGRFVAGINNSLYNILRRLDEPLLTTAFYLIVDVEAGELRFASAGHPSPFLVRRKTQTVEAFKSFAAHHGPALGLFERATYPTGRCPALPGDLIVLFTDGLFEARGSNQEEFGQERLLAAVRRRLALPTAALFDRLLEEAKEFAVGNDFDDDVCLVGVEVARTGA